MKTTISLLEAAKNAKAAVAAADTVKKNEALRLMSDALLEDADKILAENALDMDEARGNISPVMLDRLLLDKKRIEGMADGIRDVAALPDPVGMVLKRTARPNGLIIEKTAVAMGVIAIIYESRPNVTSDAAALALKAGSACVLRSGKEAHRSAAAIVAAFRRGISRSGLPEDALVLIEDTTRDSAKALMGARGYIDLLIPRGGAGLIRSCVEDSAVAVLETGTGICHIYVDKDSDIGMALDIVENAKASRPSVCNSAEVCLVHEDIAEGFLPKLYERLTVQNEHHIRLRLCEKAAKIIPGEPAAPGDFDTEFLDYIMAVRVVENTAAAVSHIASHSTGHSEAIVTQDDALAKYFLSRVDSAAVYHNASTRFTDGGEFGLGCEMGISTQKLHARGPLGLEELCSYKYIVRGTGQVR